MCVSYVCLYQFLRHGVSNFQFCFASCILCSALLMCTTPVVAAHSVLNIYMNHNWTQWDEFHETTTTTVVRKNLVLKYTLAEFKIWRCDLIC